MFKNLNEDILRSCVEINRVLSISIANFLRATNGSMLNFSNI